MNEGFLCDKQRILSLEVVEKFYEMTKQKPRKATRQVKNILDLCPAGHFVLQNQAVIFCVYDDSKTNNEYFHAVRVFKGSLNSRVGHEL